VSFVEKDVPPEAKNKSDELWLVRSAIPSFNSSVGTESRVPGAVS